ncbi:SIR2 family protein, partial [Chloroflexota bacterium]
SKDGNAIHPRVNRALTESSLVMLGYSLRNWDFRVLFRGIIKPRPQSLRMTNVAIQLEETPLEKEYVKKYLGQVEFEVEWSDAHSFIQEIYEGWEQ